MGDEKMQRTISAMVGKGSVNHNSRKFRAENKDYSLLRKVFGRKQIDDLLEQARTVKGRKRDNTRSR
ncbi:hypothetical protein [Oribacterium sp. P9]|uniref:hypothetical protein n=1 Tax=Oribacterium sp. P9 TaxID=3378068 RepID=UPI003966B587